MLPDLNIAIVGLGNVGAGVVKLLQTHGDIIAKRAQRQIKIIAVHARDKNKNRGVDLSAFEWVNDPLSLCQRQDIDVVVELVGGDEGLAKNLVEKSLKSKKNVVTANKALIAKHGYDLAVLAEQNDVSLNYEASVAGGIPVIKTIREGLAGNDVSAVYGILNGTCNYILTEMRQTGRDFDDVLKEAQDKGYAESDPTFDIDGIDAAHKLCILCALSFGMAPDFNSIDKKGIRHITLQDIKFADELGYRIKLLGVGKKNNGKIEQSVEPCLVPIRSALGNVEGVFNAVFTQSDFADKTMLEGRGAGQNPTASAVMSDLIDIARGYMVPTFGVSVQDLQRPKPMDAKDVLSENYIHLIVRDEAGVIADVSSILRDFNISIETMIQRGRDPGQPVSVVITTHECSRDGIRSTIEKIKQLKAVMASPTVLRILGF